MPQTPCPLATDSTFFCTVRLQDRRSDLLVREMNRLRNATRTALTACPFRIDDIVVLPNAIHTIWTLPAGDADVSRRWGLLKAQFSRGLPAPAHRHPASARRCRWGWSPIRATGRTRRCTARCGRARGRCRKPAPPPDRSESYAVFNAGRALPAAQSRRASPKAPNSTRDTGSMPALYSGCHCTDMVKPGAPSI